MRILGRLIKKLFLLVIIANVGQAFSQEQGEMSCPEDFSPQKVFKELMATEFAGARLILPRESCLDQRNFSHIRVEKDAPQESGVQKIYVLQEDSLEVLDMDEKSEKNGVYRARFRVKAKERGDEKFQNFEDEALFIVYPSEKLQRLNGCGAFLDGPERVYVRERCLSESDE